MNKRLIYLKLVFNYLLGILVAILLPFGIEFIGNLDGHRFFIKALILFIPIMSAGAMFFVLIYGVRRFVYDYLYLLPVLMEVIVLVFLGVLYITTRM